MVIRITRRVPMRAYLAMVLTLPLAGCAGGANLLAGGASFGTEVVARGIIGKIDNDGGLFGQNTSTVINSPEQQAQKEQDAALKQRYPLAAGGDKGTTIIQQGGGVTPGYGGGYANVGYPQQGYGGGNPAYINDGPAFDRSYYGGGGYGPSYPPYYGRGW